MKHISVLSKSINDFFSKKFLTLTLLPLFIALGVLLSLALLGAGELLDILKASLDDGTALENSYPIISKILSFAIVHYLISIIIYFFGAFLAVIFSVIIGVLCLGFLTPVVVKTLHKRYYGEYELRSVSVAKTISTTIFILLKFLLLLILVIPLMFVPVLNILAINAPFFYLFYKLLIFDVTSNITDDVGIKELLRRGGVSLLFITFVFYLLALIPLVGLFLQLFFAIYLTHYIFTFLIKK
ncbi:MAG: EI24 domain-containing protein [Campylobacteraceae bacterium]|jgi:hypothetical protein|nr:EI24 domain-containing protein [Campylobacteraceae bacterium]